MVDAALCGFFQPVEKFVEGAKEVGAFLGWKRVTNGRAVATRRQRAVTLETELIGDFDEGVAIRRVQPAAADVEGNLWRSHDSVAASADTVARFEDND